MARLARRTRHDLTNETRYAQTVQTSAALRQSLNPAKGSALMFKLAVEATGHDWPDDYIKGVGWAREQQPDDPPEPSVPFGDYALAFVRGLSGVAARTRHDYQRDLSRHLLPTFGELDIRDSGAINPGLVRAWVNGIRMTHRGGGASHWAEDDPEPERHARVRLAEHGRGRPTATCFQPGDRRAAAARGRPTWPG